MKKISLKGFSVGALAMLSLAACNDGLETGSSTGTISPLVNYDPTVISSRAVEIGDITVNDLTLTLTSADGSFSETFAAAEFPTDRQFIVGKYTLTASYGDPLAEGFGLPAVHGEAELSVNEGKQTAVELTACPSKAMVSVTFDKTLTEYMTSLSATLHTLAGTDHTFSTDETRALYVRPGSVSLSVSFVKPNGKQATMEVAGFEAQERHHYRINVSQAGSGSGEIQGLTVSFDDTLEKEDITLDISDQALSLPAPTVTPEGFTDGEVFSIVEGGELPRAIFSIEAPGQIAKAVLSTSGSPLINLGWPVEVDLVNAPAEMQQTLTTFGLKDMGLFRNPARLAAVDLSKVASRIPFIDEEHNLVSFTLTVTDKNGKQSEPVGFSVKIDNLVFDVTAPEDYVYMGSGAVNFLVNYNGEYPLKDVLSVQYENMRGNLDDAIIASITPQSRAAGLYEVSVNIGEDYKTPIRLKVNCGSARSSMIEIPVMPALAVNDLDVFATTAKVSVTSNTFDAIELSANGGTTFAETTYSKNGGTLLLGRLTPGTNYLVRARVGNVYSNAASFTTERAEQIANSDMESWTTQRVSSGANKWTKYIPSSPWATLNDHTMSKAGMLCVRTAAESTRSTSDAHSGTAAELLTVGWDVATTFNDCKQHTAGELYLGSYEGGANYGVPFSSRPFAVSFWCKFAKFKDGEKGVAEVQVLDAKGNVIASGTLYPSNEDWQKHTIRLDYAAGAAKAAKIIIRFKSNSKETLDKSDVQSYTPGDTVTHPAGSKLYVDDIELVY